MTSNIHIIVSYISLIMISVLFLFMALLLVEEAINQIRQKQAGNSLIFFILAGFLVFIVLAAIGAHL